MPDSLAGFVLEADRLQQGTGMERLERPDNVTISVLMELMIIAHMCCYLKN